MRPGACRTLKNTFLRGCALRVPVKFAIWILLLLSLPALAQTCAPINGVQCTANLNLWLPPLNYLNWNVPTNANWNTIDSNSLNWIPSGPAYSLQFANPTAKGFSSDPNITINPLIHAITSPIVNGEINGSQIGSNINVCAYISSLASGSHVYLPSGSYNCSSQLIIPADFTLTCPKGLGQTQITFTGSTTPFLEETSSDTIDGCSFVFPSSTAGDGLKLSGYEVKLEDVTASGGNAGGNLLHVAAYSGTAQSGTITIDNFTTTAYLGTALYIDHAIGVNLKNIQLSVAPGLSTTGIVIDTGTSGVNGSNVQSSSATNGGLIVKNSTGGSGAYNATPDFLFFDQLVSDCAATCPSADAIDFASSLTPTPLIFHCTNCWAAGYGENGVHISGGTDITWVAGTIRSNSLSGILIDNAAVSGVTISGATIDANNTSDTANIDGIDVTAAAPHITISGGSIGNRPDTTGFQKYGISVTANSPYLSITGVDLSGNVTDCYLITDTSPWSAFINGPASDANCRSSLFTDFEVDGAIYNNGGVYSTIFDSTNGYQLGIGIPVIPGTATLWQGNSTGGPELVLVGTTGTITGTSLSATCDSGTVTVTGATVGHPVAVSSTTGADVGGAFNVRASVTATNTVTVYVCGTGTPSSLAYNVTVF